MEVDRLKGEVNRLTARLIEIEGACHAGTASEQMQLGNTISQLRCEVDRLRAENARLAAVCRLGYETFEWLLPHCDVGKDRMQVALIELNKASDSTALRELMAPTIELIERWPCPECDGTGTKVDGYGNPHQCQFCFEKNGELARLRAITGDKT